MRALSPAEYAELADLATPDPEKEIEDDESVLDALVARRCIDARSEDVPGEPDHEIVHWSINDLGRLALRVAVATHAVTP